MQTKSWLFTMCMFTVVWTHPAAMGQSQNLYPIQRPSPPTQLFQEGIPVLAEREEQEQPLSSQQQVQGVTPPGHNSTISLSLEGWMKPITITH